MRDKATQMGIEHLTRVMNKYTKRGFTAHAHVHRLLSQVNHWPREALESNPLKLPTLRILRLASHIPGLEYDCLPPLYQDNDITTSITEASNEVDNTRQAKRATIQGQMDTRTTTKWSENNASPYNTPIITQTLRPPLGNGAKQLEYPHHNTPPH